MKKHIISILPVVGLCLMADSCDTPKSAAQKEAAIVEQQNQIYAAAQPAPIFDWSLERHLMTELYKARNNAVVTYSYVRNQYTGKILSSCLSVGFPISAATQLTSPESMQRIAYDGGYAYDRLPQNEPNGLFSPAESRGTYVMCLNKDGKVTPRYYEEDVEAYVTPMVEVNGTLIEQQGGKASITIDPTRK